MAAAAEEGHRNANERKRVTACGIEWRQAKLRVEANNGASNAMTSIGVDQCYIPVDRRNLTHTSLSRSLTATYE